MTSLFPRRILTSWAGFRTQRLGLTLPRSETQRLERMLAAGRLLLVGCTLLAIGFHTVESPREKAIATGLLGAYLAYSLAVLLAIRSIKELSPRATWAVHIADIVWVGCMGLLVGGPTGLYIGFYFFVLVAAAYRWGLQECLLTIVGIVVVLAAQMVVSSFWPGTVSALTLIPVFIRVAYVGVLGILVGQIAEQNRRLREEPLAIARLIRKARVDAGMRGTLHGVLSEFLRLLPARRILLAVWESSHERLFLWSGELKAGVTDLQLELHSLDPAQRGLYFAANASQAYHCALGPKGLRTLALDAEGQLLQDGKSFVVPEGFLAQYTFHSIASVGFTFGGEWESRMFLLDPRFNGDQEMELRFFQNLVREVNPAVYNVYLLRTLRHRASAMERARVARELHDGAIQSLISVEMQMDVLRRRCNSLDETQREAELRRLQSVVHDQVLELRELMQQMKPVDFDPRHMPDFLADAVERFRHDSGIETRFLSDLDTARIPPRVARELARIVQEALTNIRRHSGARNAVVQFTPAGDGGWKLVVDDDGRGFDFSGTLDLAQLDMARKGPVVIKERVRAIGAELKIDSLPGRGTRLEIHMPRKAYAAHR